MKLINMQYLKFTVFFLFISTCLFATDDIEQWRGPDRNGHYPEKNLMKSWPENGPELLWSFEGIGNGFSSATISNDIELAWKQPVLDTHHGGVIYYEGYIYGSNWINNSKGNWVCLDWNTGEVMYEKEWETKGAIIEADDMFYLYDERRGTVALAQPDPQDLKIVSTFRNKFGTGPHWAHPSIKNGVLYVRHGKVLAAYKID